MSTWKNEYLPDELPYDKFLKYGVEKLSDVELLAILIRSGTKEKNPLELSREVLKLFDERKGLLGLFHLEWKDLLSIKGIGKVKAIQLICVAEIAKRISYTKAREGMDFTSSQKIAWYYMESLRHEQKEIFMLCMLDNKCKLIKDCKLFVGTINSTIVSCREIFVEAFKQGASYIIILHNHPSGDPTPSKEDRQMTQKIKEVSGLVDIPLLDHIIIGDNQYISFHEKGLL